MKKQEEYSWLSEVNSQSLQAKLEDLDKAYVSFFKKKTNFPKFKSKKNNQSFRIPQSTKVDFENNKIYIPKFLKGIKFSNSRIFKGVVLSSTISKTPTNKYYISILVTDNKEIQTKPEIKEETTIGIDLGITNFIALSTGEKIDNPKHLKHKLKKLKAEHRKLSRKQQGSNNREKQRIKLTKVYEKVTDSRKDFHHKLSHKLTHDNQVNTIIMETLDIKKMMKNERLAQHIQDCSWYQFQTFLNYKCDWYGKNFIQIGQYEPSSKLCTCGVINRELTLKDRVWTCKECDTIHDRDILAVNNIKKIGLGQSKFTSVENRNSDSLKQKSSKN